MQIAIVGSGFSGLCMGIMLKKAGINSFTIYERADSLGGTWRDNSYPGAACDVPSHVYSFSFEQNPNWSKQFSGHAEILQYLNDCADKFDIRKHIKFNTNIEAAHFNDNSKQWEIKANGKTILADIYISGAGPLNRPVIPKFKGLENFKGTTFHSSNWHHDYDLTEKKVAIIGTGASAIQIVPEIADEVAELTLYQRTAPWVIPKPDRQLTAFEKWIFRNIPATQWLTRQFLYWRNEVTGYGFVKNTNILKWAEKIGRWHIKRQIKDKRLREKVTPNFRMGCKRILLSNNYYPSLTKSNVSVETVPIEMITESGIKTQNNTEKEFDTIVFCTGFNAADFPEEFTVIGKNGLNIKEVWAQGPEAYLGTNVSGFPNLFFIIGPNTGLGHNSMVYMIEANVHYIVECIKHLQQKGLKSMDVKSDAFVNYNKNLQAKMGNTIWSSGCNAWYTMNDGKNTTLWPDFTFNYKKRTKNIVVEDYEWG